MCCQHLFLFGALKQQIRRWSLLIASSYICLLVLWCEVGVFYATLWTSCSWPEASSDSGVIKTMFLSDTHLLGRRKGHWFDKLRREWQMHVSYKAAQTLLKPEYVMILGDVLDEGQIASDEEFHIYKQTFHDLFPVNENTKRIVVVGNHDIGFHDRILFFEPYLRKRFENAFNTSLVETFTLKGVTFVTLNSMALEGDGCHLCQRAVHQIHQLAIKLSNCQRNKSCGRPVLLMHFPLYRESDEICDEIDSDKSDSRKVKFRPKIDCVSQESTQLILKELKPRVVFTGHTHHGCIVRHTNEQIEEWTVASFSWRNKRTPSFLLAIISAEEYSISKCLLPNEISVISTYIVAGIVFICFLLKFKYRF